MLFNERRALTLFGALRACADHFAMSDELLVLQLHDALEDKRLFEEMLLWLLVHGAGQLFAHDLQNVGYLHEGIDSLTLSTNSTRCVTSLTVDIRFRSI